MWESKIWTSVPPKTWHPTLCLWSSKLRMDTSTSCKISCFLPIYHFVDIHAVANGTSRCRWCCRWFRGPHSPGCANEEQEGRTSRGHQNSCGCTVHVVNLPFRNWLYRLGLKNSGNQANSPFDLIADQKNDDLLSWLKENKDQINAARDKMKVLSILCVSLSAHPVDMGCSQV